jgi:hypothetical protein
VLAVTPYVDSDHTAVLAFALEATADAATARGRASRLFTAVRERLRYHAYTIVVAPDEYRASTVLQRDRTYYVPKAMLLCVAAVSGELARSPSAEACGMSRVASDCNRGIRPTREC